jgi:hypothetical protein
MDRRVWGMNRRVWGYEQEGMRYEQAYMGTYKVIIYIYIYILYIGMCGWSPSMYKRGDRVRVVQDSRGIVDTSLLDEEGVVVSLDPRVYAHGFRVYEVRLERLSVTSTYYFNEFNLARCAGTGRSPGRSPPA